MRLEQNAPLTPLARAIHAAAFAAIWLACNCLPVSADECSTVKECSERAVESAAKAQSALADSLNAIDSLKQENKALVGEVQRLESELARINSLLQNLEIRLESKVDKSQLVGAVRVYSENPWREIIRLQKPDQDGLQKALQQGWKRVGNTFMVVVPSDD